jgi:hypothetical protein
MDIIGALNWGRSKRLIVWGLLGALLIDGGFLMDGTTETGHHLFLILGGVAIGAGAMREVRKLK